MDFRERITNLVLAGFQAIYIPTSEENRCETELEAVGDSIAKIEEDQNGMSVVTWDSIAGFSWFPKGSTNIQDPIEALLSLSSDIIEKGPDPAKATVQGPWGRKSALFVFRDFHEYLKDPGVRRAFRNLVEKNKLNSSPFYRRPIILLSPFLAVPDGIKHCITIAKFDPPSMDRLAYIFKNIQMGIQASDPIKAQCSPELQYRIIQAMLGLREREAEDTLSFGLRVCKGIKEELVDVIEDQKAQQLERSEILRYIPKDKIANENEVAGYQELKDWLQERKLAFTPQARQLKIDPPKGIVLLGVPGTFKTGVGKIIARILGYPLIFFNVARIGAGLVGESQRRMEEALQTVDIIDGSVLLIDDADKLFSGVVSGFQGDSGVRQQTFQQFLVWLTEHTSRTFVVMTMNRVQGIPDEFLRKGRWTTVRPTINRSNCWNTLKPKHDSIAGNGKCDRSRSLRICGQSAAKHLYEMKVQRLDGRHR